MAYHALRGAKPIVCIRPKGNYGWLYCAEDGDGIYQTIKDSLECHSEEEWEFKIAFFTRQEQANFDEFIGW